MNSSELNDQIINNALECKALQFGQFTLKSGRQSPYFFNSSNLLTGHNLSLLGQAFAQQLLQSGLKFDLLFGPAYKGIPLVSATAIALSQQGLNIAVGFDRKEEKTHGEGGWFIGQEVTNRRAIVIDDVLTKGTSMRQSIEQLQQAQAHVVAVMVILDRQEKGNSEYFASLEIAREYNVPVFSLIALADLVQKITPSPELKSYLAEHGL